MTARDPHDAGEDAPAPAMSPCCTRDIAWETVWLLVPRADDPKLLGQTEVGRVRVCMKCHKAFGAFKLNARSPKGFTVAQWPAMLAVRRTTPFYFVEDGLGGFKPEGAR